MTALSRDEHVRRELERKSREWSVRTAALCAVVLAPLLLWGGSAPSRDLSLRSYLVIAVLAAAVLIRHLHRASLKREIGLAFDLAAKERQLEEQVAERTAELVNAAREWRAAFDSTDDLMLMVDSGGRVVKVNLATALFSGKAPGSLVGTQAAALLHRAGLDGGLEPLGAVLRTGKRAAAEVRHDSSGRWFLATAEPIPQGRAQAGGIVLTLRDITDIKAMEQAVSEARDDWEETFDSIREGITIHDANFVVLRANTAARRLLGCEDDALEGAKCFELFHGLESPIGGCPGCETLRTGAPTTIDLHEPLLGRYLEITTLPRAGGGITHVVHDISERKQAMDELSRAAERLQGILGHAPFGVFIVNEQFRVEFANAAMDGDLGLPARAVRGRLARGFPGLPRTRHGVARPGGARGGALPARPGRIPLPGGPARDRAVHRHPHRRGRAAQGRRVRRGPDVARERGGGAPPPQRAAAAGPEDGVHRHARVGDRPRLQQHPARGHRPHRRGGRADSPRTTWRGPNSRP